jgi:3-hydroxyisobutyrate dehydrogenase-like beta-hydroxyacid dehydrogenase
MLKAGVIGIGDMGSGLALNLIKNGFSTSGVDLLPDRMSAFTNMGGIAANSPAEVGRHADAVFVMVMNGQEVNDVVLGEDGLLTTMKPGSAILLTATIKPAEAKKLGEAMQGSGVHLIDSPVSGGYPGAQNGTLTLMSSASDDVLSKFKPVMEAVSGSIHHVGTEVGMGQTVKACLQSLIGSVFSATFEASVLAAKAGVDGEAFYKVVSTSSVGCGVTSGSLENIIDRQFEGTGSHIRTMHKDLTISLDLACELGVPMHTAATAMQLFHAGKTKHPQGDNWIVTRVVEDIVGAELHRNKSD